MRSAARSSREGRTTVLGSRFFSSLPCSTRFLAELSPPQFPLPDCQGTRPRRPLHDQRFGAPGALSGDDDPSLEEEGLAKFWPGGGLLTCETLRIGST